MKRIAISLIICSLLSGCGIYVSDSWIVATPFTKGKIGDKEIDTQMIPPVIVK